jgi:subtilase family serine protease
MARLRHVVVLISLCGMIAGPLTALAAAGDGGRAGADLAVVAGSYAGFPAGPHVADEITSNITIRNIGDADPGAFEVVFYLNDTATPIKPFDYNVTFGGLSPGDDQAVSMAWKTDDLTAGVPYTVIMIIDPENLVADANRTNNRYDQSVTLLPRPVPDLYILPEEVRLDPPEPFAGDNVTISAPVHNGGEGNIPFVDVFFYLNDTDTYLSGFTIVHDVNASSPRNASTVWRTGDLPAGLYHVLIYVNPPVAPDHVPESNVQNNLVNLSVALGQRTADLALLGQSWLPATPLVGDVVTVTVTVSNAGSAPAPATLAGLYAGFGVDQVANATVPALAAKESAEVSIEWNTTGMPEGFTRLRTVVDPEQAVDDTNRSNNSLAWNLTLAGIVDLALENLTVSPLSARPGDAVSFAVSVHNIGSLRCGSANLTVRVGGTEADRFQLLTLAAGGMLNATLKWTTAGLSPGNYTYELSVAVGPNDNESRLANNNLSGVIALLPPAPMADLVVENIGLPSQPPSMGDQLTVSVVVANIGDLDANASSLMATLSSAGGMSVRLTDAPVAVPALAAGRSVTVNITADTARFAPGSYTLTAVSDYGGAVAESNETNNQLTRALTILEPPVKAAVLSVGDIFFAGQRKEGEHVDVIVSVRNTGDAAALDVVVTFLIDGKVAATQSLDQIAANTARNATLTWTFSPGDHTMKAVVSSTGLADVTGERAMNIEAAPSQTGNLLLAAGLGIMLILITAVLARALSRPRSPGPAVRLVEEEE